MYYRTLGFDDADYWPKLPGFAPSTLPAALKAAAKTPDLPTDYAYQSQDQQICESVYGASYLPLSPHTSVHTASRIL